MDKETVKLILNKLDKLDDKVEKQGDRLVEIDKTLVRNTASLEEHMRRTDLLEKEFQPVRKHVSIVNGGLKIISGVAVLIGIVVGIVKVLEYFKIGV